MAYREFDYETAKSKLLSIVSDLEYKCSKAAASLMEGLEEALTVHRQKVPWVLREALCNTSPMDSANSVCRGIIRRVSNFRDGEMVLRYAAAGFRRKAAFAGLKNTVKCRSFPISTTVGHFL